MQTGCGKCLDKQGCPATASAACVRQQYLPHQQRTWARLKRKYRTVSDALAVPSSRPSSRPCPSATWQDGCPSHMQMVGRRQLACHGRWSSTHKALKSPKSSPGATAAAPGRWRSPAGGRGTAQSPAESPPAASAAPFHAPAAVRTCGGRTQLASGGGLGGSLFHILCSCWEGMQATAFSSRTSSWISARFFSVSTPAAKEEQQGRQQERRQVKRAGSKLHLASAGSPLLRPAAHLLKRQAFPTLPPGYCGEPCSHTTNKPSPATLQSCCNAAVQCLAPPQKFTAKLKVEKATEASTTISWLMPRDWRWEGGKGCWRW